MTSDTFAVANLVMWVGLLIVLALAERRGRHVTTRWHRDVRTRRISSEEVMRMIEKATKGAKR